MAKPTDKIVSMTPAQLQETINQAVQQALEAERAKAPKAVEPPKNTLVDGKTERQLKIDVAVVRAFKRAGYGDVKPREDVRTYNKWAAAGYLVKPGEKALKISGVGFRLFHLKQVQWVGIPPKEQAPSQAEIDAFVAGQAALTPEQLAQFRDRIGQIVQPGDAPVQPSTTEG